MNPYEIDLLSRGLARVYRGRLVPVMQGGDGTDEPADTLFADAPEGDEALLALTDEELSGLIEDFEATVAEVTASPRDFVSSPAAVYLNDAGEPAEYTAQELLAATTNAVEVVLPALRAEAARRADAAPADPAAPPAADAQVDDAAFAALQADPAEPVEPVAAAAPPARRGRLPRPTAANQPAQHEPPDAQSVALVAAGGAHDLVPGTRFGSELELAEAMVNRHRQFGQTAPGTVERYAIAKARWRDDYPTERRLHGNDIEANFDIVKPVANPAAIKRIFRDRVRSQFDLLASAGGWEDVLTASGGLCAPVTPWYNLQFISVPVRPVQGSLPSFNADRGGLRYAQPAALSAVTTAVGLITEAEDFAGGSMATKSCQVIPCPPFQETDVDIIYHCLQFGNLGVRAFPELVAQWNNLVLAAHARLAESNLLTMIDGFSTQVTAGSLGLGASATLFSQILTAAEGMRNRNRMDPEAVLRLMLPYWAVSLIISDVIRTQFERFDTDQAKVLALLRSFNIEPTFYIDTAYGRGQVYGAQGAGPLLPFPAEIVWYLFPEGSFLYLDAGTLELGIVRDSVLNKTNDFQIFGETFENVAYVGVESLAVVTSTCDSGTVSLPTSIDCPINYSAEYIEDARLAA